MDLNRVSIIGNVGADPEYHDMRGNEQLAKLSVATTRKWKNKNSGEMQEQTQWHNVVIFNQYIVKLVKQYVQKGTRVYIEGESITRSYDKDGTKHYINELVVPNIKGELIILAKGKENNGQPRHPADQTNEQWKADYDGKPEFDDDIPF